MKKFLILLTLLSSQLSFAETNEYQPKFSSTSITNSTDTLFMAKNSPFARMVRVLTASFPELNQRTEIRAEDLTNKSADLMIDNPAGRVPKLVWNGVTILDSKFILMFLSGVVNQPNLAIKSDIENKIFENSRDIMEMAKENFYERKKENFNPEIILNNEKHIVEKLQELNLNIEPLIAQKDLTIAKIAVICALDYTKNRGQFDWTEVNNLEQLTLLYSELSELPAFKNTVPEALPKI